MSTWLPMPAETCVRRKHPTTRPHNMVEDIVQRLTEKQGYSSFILKSMDTRRQSFRVSWYLVRSIRVRILSHATASFGSNRYEVWVRSPMVFLTQFTNRI